MGCGASTPVKPDDPHRTTTAQKHNEMRTREGSQRGPEFNVGEHYRLIKHLGAW